MGATEELVRFKRGSIGGQAGDYSLDFTALGANESPISQGVWTNATTGTGGNSPLAPNVSMQIRLSADSTTRICCETGATNDYDDSLSFVPGFPGNQRVEARFYRASGYAPTSTNHEMEIHVGCASYGTANKRCVELGFNYAGGYFVAGFNGDLVSWQAPAGGNMSSPWYTAATGSGTSPADNDLFVMELNRSAKTIKAWQNTTLVIDLQWNDLTHVTAAAQSVLNDLGNGAGLGALRRVGGDATEGSMGWRSIHITSTLQDAGG